MVQDEKVAADGADEQMLGADEKLAERRDEVKFIKGDQQNGDAKIDIGNPNGKQAFTGMSKEELMKYANDPFWVRLRWIFFVCFWAIWVGMLVGAILIIVGAPKCAAPQPLPWYKRGVHAKFGSLDDASPKDINVVEKLQAAGAIYELPAALTYQVKERNVEAQIKELVDHYKNSDVRVILDLTPNIMSKDSRLVKEALTDVTKRDAFVWVNGAGAAEPTNWLKVGGNRTAWEKVGDSYVLSQFDDGFYDLKMNNSLVRQEFGDVLQHLIGLGVHGFRLKNTKFFMLTPNLADEDVSTFPKDLNSDVSSYGFYNHKRTAFQEGLGDVLYDYLSIVKNASADAFLSVAEDIIRPSAYEISNAGPLGIDLPIYGRFVHTLSSPLPNENVQLSLNQTLEMGKGWLQWDFGVVEAKPKIHHSAIALFMSLLPGVPVVPANSFMYNEVSAQTYTNIELLRKSPSYMHGEIKMYSADPLVAYSRIKSGNPGYFVLLNPTDQPVKGNFVDVHDLPDKMTVLHVSDDYLNNNATKVQVKAKFGIAELELEPYSTVILTYVPVKAE
ncbi:uncharacterized protein LOC115623487 isoform X2 [Scaptodrosophila lebanonensis]|uniref:alpha-glucosidase n=1 Tax=Drosophila lebanonensis TaxID=7225 RepID=A0A6J2TCI2_DROLE|nr:uncharacterized protein LOC115623487 isoform X2 [Scaptodrosophila lebanonensis]